MNGFYITAIPVGQEYFWVDYAGRVHVVVKVKSTSRTVHYWQDNQFKKLSPAMVPKVYKNVAEAVKARKKFLANKAKNIKKELVEINEVLAYLERVYPEEV